MSLHQIVLSDESRLQAIFNKECEKCKRTPPKRKKKKKGGREGMMRKLQKLHLGTKDNQL